MNLRFLDILVLPDPPRETFSCFDDATAPRNHKKSKKARRYRHNTSADLSIAADGSTIGQTANPSFSPELPGEMRETLVRNVNQHSDPVISTGWMILCIKATPNLWWNIFKRLGAANEFRTLGQRLSRGVKTIKNEKLFWLKIDSWVVGMCGNTSPAPDFAAEHFWDFHFYRLYSPWVTRSRRGSDLWEISYWKASQILWNIDHTGVPNWPPPTAGDWKFFDVNVRKSQNMLKISICKPCLKNTLVLSVRPSERWFMSNSHMRQMWDLSNLIFKGEPNRMKFRWISDLGNLILEGEPNGTRSRGIRDLLIFWSSWRNISDWWDVWGTTALRTHMESKNPSR